MKPGTIRTVLSNVSFPNTAFIVVEGEGASYLQIQQTLPCNATGVPTAWGGRKWRLSEHMTKSEIVQTAFLAVLTAAEHEVRETFKYQGAAIFGPHFNVDRLVTLTFDQTSQDVRT